MGGNWATGYALRPIPAHRKKRTIHLLQNRTFLFTSDSKSHVRQATIAEMAKENRRKA